MKRLETPWWMMIPTIWMLVCASAARADLPKPPPLANEDARENWFVQATYDLHLKIVEGREVHTKRSMGGYAQYPEFYEEVAYHDADSGRLLSTIKWEREHPDRIHAIEVLRYDDQDRLTRRFTAWYMPERRDSPRSTWISLYAYNGDLVAYRQFDATDLKVSEICEGTREGKKVSISLWDTLEIANAESDPESVMYTPEYRACFKGLSAKSAGKYLIPQ